MTGTGVQLFIASGRFCFVPFDVLFLNAAGCSGSLFYFFHLVRVLVGVMRAGKWSYSAGDVCTVRALEYMRRWLYRPCFTVRFLC